MLVLLVLIITPPVLPSFLNSSGHGPRPFAPPVHRPAWALLGTGSPGVGAGDHDTRPVQQLLLKRGKANLSAYALIGSKSQFGEEENAWNRYFFGHRNGTFLELGGLDGLLYSNSFVLERSFGWRGVIVEGSPGNFEEVVRNRPEVLAIHSAVCNTTRMVAFLERRTKGCCRGVVESLRENSLGQPSESDPRVIQVPCRPLRDVLLESPIRHFNLMFLDVEGGEMGVLQGIDYAAITFDVICVEGNLERASAYEQVLAPQGYDLVRRRVKMRRNAWFVRRGFNASSRDGVYK